MKPPVRLESGEHQFQQAELGFFAAAERVDILKYIVASEKEKRKIAADLGLGEHPVLIPYLIYHGLAASEALKALVKVTHLDICAESEAAAVRRHTPHQYTQKRCLAAAVCAEDEHPLALIHLHIAALKKPLAAEGL